MKHIYGSLCLILSAFSVGSVYAQTTCRPGIAMIDYSGHNDNSTNADMTTIQSVVPGILIDNTPHGYWNGQCLPSHYSSLGIKVFSYITGGYEGTKYHTAEDDSATNIGRIDGILTDGAYGVFLDEVSAFPSASGKAYISAMYNECQLKGLKLIVNPGVSNFDAFLVSHADFILTDEHYDGMRSPTTSEMADMSKMIVVNEGVSSAAAAAAVTDSARSKGYAYSYACADYMVVPAWLSSYMSLITFATPVPVVTNVSGTLHSDAPHGNQWYSTTSGAIAGATGQDFVPASSGYYYDIVTGSGCSSAPSDTLWLRPTGIYTAGTGADVKVYPNPASDAVFVDEEAGAHITVMDISGRTLMQLTSNSAHQKISLKELPNGIYVLRIVGKNASEGIRILKQNE